MEADEFSQVNHFLELIDWQRVVLLVLGILLLLFVVRSINRLASAFAEKFTSQRLLILQVSTILEFMLYIFGSFFLVYSVLQPPRELLLTLGGSAAVAIGFSLKDLVSSLIAGLILLFDRPFQVGDRVTFGDIYGEIKSIGLRAVRLVTLDDNLVTIPNSKFVTDAVASGNSGALDMMITVDFYLSMDADLRLARTLIFETVVTSRYVYLAKPVTIIFNEIWSDERSSIQLRVRAYVLDVKYEKAFQTDIILRGNEILRQHAIERAPSRVQAKLL